MVFIRLIAASDLACPTYIFTQIDIPEEYDSPGNSVFSFYTFIKTVHLFQSYISDTEMENQHIAVLKTCANLQSSF
jgi:hypothetical protein